MAVGPTLIYTLILIFCAVAYAILQRSLLHVNGVDAPFLSAVETDIRGLLPIALYVVAMCTAFISTIVSDVILITVAGLLSFSRRPGPGTDRT